MAAGTTILLKRKAGAFNGGDLAAGEAGVDTTNGDLYFSTDGTTVIQIDVSGVTTHIHGFEVYTPNEDWVVESAYVLHMPIKCKLLEAKIYIQSQGDGPISASLKRVSDGAALLNSNFSSASNGWEAKTDINTTNFPNGIIPEETALYLDITDNGVTTGSSAAQGLQLFLIVQLFEP